jgi:hypothetical protein
MAIVTEEKKAQGRRGFTGDGGRHGHGQGEKQKKGGEGTPDGEKTRRVHAESSPDYWRPGKPAEFGFSRAA